MVIPPGFALLQVRFELVGGHDCVSNWGYALDDPLTQSDVDDASDAIAPAWKAQLNSGSLYQGVRVYEGQDGDPLVWESNSSFGVGGRGVALCPPSTQGLISKRSALAGRKHRGRVFIPDMAESQVGDLGDLNSTAISLIDAIWAGHNAVTGTPWGVPVILHSDVTAPDTITAFVTGTKVATLRRRYDR